MTIQLVIQTLVLPLLLSLAVFRFRATPRWQAGGLLLAWLPACFWIQQLPGFPPEEAVDWLWLAGSAFVATVFLPTRWRGLAGLLAFLAALLLIGLPVLQYEFSAALGLEFGLALLAAAVLIFADDAPPAPATLLGANATALALASALAGSLLIAQLAGALAASIGLFALDELRQRLRGSRLQGIALLPPALLCLLLLAIARLYAGLPAGPALLLLLALMALRWKWRAAVDLPLNPSLALSLLLSGSAVVWTFLLQDGSATY